MAQTEDHAEPSKARRAVSGSALLAAGRAPELSRRRHLKDDQIALWIDVISTAGSQKR